MDIKDKYYIILYLMLLPMVWLPSYYYIKPSGILPFLIFLIIMFLLVDVVVLLKKFIIKI